MRPSRQSRSILLLVAVLGAEGSLTFADPPAEPESRDPDFVSMGLTPEELRYTAPGEAHAPLGFLVGRFEVRGMMSAGAGEDDIQLTGVIESRWELGGRFVETRGEYTWGDQPIRTIRYTGFDSRSNEYLILDLDNWRVFPIEKRGVHDQESGALSFTYAYPQIGGAPLKIIEVFTPLEHGSYQIENRQVLPDGRIEVRSRAEYTRIAQAPEQAEG